MTTAPARAAIGAKRLEMPPPAENSAICTPAKLDSVSSCIVTLRPRNRWVLPAERAEASRRSSQTGKLRCSRQRAISTPTAPVAPTTATTNAGTPLRLSSGGGSGDSKLRAASRISGGRLK